MKRGASTLDSGVEKGLFFVLNLIVLLTTINNFTPFQADVWGTVSDWVMIVVTTVTAFAIWFTFREQKEVTKLQLKSYLFTIRPQFTLGRMGNMFWNENGVHCELLVNKNIALNLVVVDNGIGYEKLFIPRDRIGSVAFNRPIEILHGLITDVDAASQVNISIFFQDEMLNSYTQLIHGTLGDFVIDPPQSVDSMPL